VQELVERGIVPTHLHNDEESELIDLDLEIPWKMKLMMSLR
jgi:hypothetical protein